MLFHEVGVEHLEVVDQDWSHAIVTTADVQEAFFENIVGFGCEARWQVGLSPLNHCDDGFVCLFRFIAVPTENEQHLLSGEVGVLRNLQLFLSDILVELT